MCCLKWEKLKFMTFKKKNKIKIKDEWVKGTAGHVKRVTKSTDYDEINRAMFGWFVSARTKGFPISGPLIQTDALETANN